MNNELNDNELSLIINVFSDPTIEICECCPKIGGSDCNRKCVADSIVRKLTGRTDKHENAG